MGIAASEHEHKQRLGNMNEGQGTVNMTTKELDGQNWCKKREQWSESSTGEGRELIPGKHLLSTLVTFTAATSSS